MTIIHTNGGFLITQTKQIGSRIFEKLLLDAKVDAFNGSQGRILYVLWQSDNIPIVELSRKTGLAKTTLTSMLERMEASGLIHRAFDTNDRRQVLISLTEKAHGLNGEYEKVSQRMNEIYYAGFSDAEIILFEDTLRRILSNLHAGEQLL